MPVDDQEGRSGAESQGAGETAPRGEARAEEESAAPPPPGARRRWRRVVTRRNAVLTALALACAAILIVLVAILLYRTGQIDRIIANQIKRTLAEYGVRAEIREFHTKFGPRTAEIVGLELYDQQTGERLGKIDRLVATVRVEDMYALSLRRNVNLETLEIEGLELWVLFDAEGRSNFRNLHLPPPSETKRINFSYSTARVSLRNAVVHYGDERHEISGEARNLRATVLPDDPSAPAESRMNRVELAFDNSTFTYDGRAVTNISVEARARVDQVRAEIQELVLRSTVAEARLEGVMDDWRNLRYRMRVTSSVDLTQVSNIFRTETALRGAGRFRGTVEGEGDQFKVDGTVESDALAAGNIRLKNLNVQIDKASGKGVETYEAQGRAVAELLTAGDFQLNLVQVRGGVMGTGTDFRFLGELRAAAARSGETSIANLILSDAAAEYRDGNVTATAGAASAGSVTAAGARIEGARAANLRVNLRDEKNFDGSASSVTTGPVLAKDTRIEGVAASNVRAEARGGVTRVVTDSVRVGGGTIVGARVGSINVAGVRLAIYESGRVEGSTADINAGTVAFSTGKGRDAVEGRAEGVRLARPVFVVEPSGRYRASADLSLGGGVLGEVPLGVARAAVVATNNEIQLNDFTAEALRGRASGNAVINTARGPSRVNARFEGLDVGGLLAIFAGRTVPVAGATTGAINLSFPGTDFERASGTLTAQFTGETGSDISGRTPVNGELTLRADRGLFQIERAALQAGASELAATGRFSFEGDSDLQVKLTSTDAAELQRVVIATNLVPALESTLEDSGVELAGRLEFAGTVRGPLEDPFVNGRASVASLVVNGRDMGALTASIESDAAATRIPDGLLVARDGGRAQFELIVPRAGQNNVTLNAALERYDLGAILAAAERRRAFDDDEDLTAQLAAVGPTSGRINVTGLPDAMRGSADLRAGPGEIRGEPFDEIIARATFDGSAVQLDALDARFRSGRLNARGTVGLGVISPELSDNTRFDVEVKGGNVRLDVVAALFGGAGRLPRLEGMADFAAQAAGDTRDPRSYRITVDGEGRDVVVNGQRAGALRLTGRTENQRFTLQLTTGIFGEPQVLTAEVDLSRDELPTTVRTSLAGVDLSNLFAALLPGANVRVTGRATGTLEAAGPLYSEDEGFSLAGLKGTARFSQFTIQIEDVQLSAEDPLIVQFSPNEVTFDRTRFTGPNTNLEFGGTAALGEGGRQNFTVKGDLNLRVLNGLSRNNFFAGVTNVEVRVGGTFADPRVTGFATVSNATVSTLIENERLTVQNINGNVRFTADRAEIQSLAGTLGGGRVAIAGGALISGFRPTQFRLTVRGEQITVPFPEDFRSTADADLVVQGDLRAQIISGTVNLRRAEYTKDIEIADLIDRRREASITEGVGGEGGFGSNVRLDLRVEGRDALVVRNNLADAAGSVSLQIRGPVEEPIVSGRITLTRGTINFIRGQRYEVTRALIDLPPRQELDPVLNIQAEGEIRGYRIIVGITGPLSQPTATTRSEPALPQADVVSLITTGNLAQGEEGQSTLAQTGFGTAASLLSETLISQPVQRATDRLFGLNRFEIDPLISGRGGASPTARLTVGRQINRNLSLTYSTNVTTDQNQVLAVEYRVSDRLSFVAQYQQGPINTLRSQRDNFSFEIRFRKRF